MGEKKEGSAYDQVIEGADTGTARQAKPDTPVSRPAAAAKAAYRTTSLQGITDLTVLSRIKPGFVPGAFNTFTYADRLTKVLRVLNVIRQASRESALQRSPFPDSIGRFRSIHFFRFAVIPRADAAGPDQFLLNVTFDGGWEPYMRIIWKPLGKLLDVMFCNTEDYPMAFQCSFEEYMRWVRKHEVAGSFFYADSAATVGDSYYLRQLEAMQAIDGGRPGADTRATGFALQDPPHETQASRHAVDTSLKVLKALDGLRDLFPPPIPIKKLPPESRHDLILLRFAQDLLSDLRRWDAEGLFKRPEFANLGAAFVHELGWLKGADEGLPRESKDRLEYHPGAVQAGIAKPYPEPVRHGVLVLLRVRNAAKARAWLSPEKVTTGADEEPDGGVHRSLALTYAGLKKLNVAQDRLERLPQEFIDGMEQRAGLLGDVRCNHPDHWSRPRRNWPWNKPPGGPPISLSSVHVVLQLRAALSKEDADTSEDGAIPVERFAMEIEAFVANGESGLEVLVVQPMRTNPQQPGEKAGRDHFGYADGISQPILSPDDKAGGGWSNQVMTGELFLGYANSRGDAPGVPDPMLDNSTFLVIRKLRQDTKEFEALLTREARKALPRKLRNDPDELEKMRLEIKAKLMGRKTDGTPMIDMPGTGENGFDFGHDRGGAACPHASHIRRANPRTKSPGTAAPRIVRRGMSYVSPRTADDGRGLVFMAYNASIAEQFEVIQRWLAGGNSSGVCSSRDDPLLGVPEKGHDRIYRYVHGEKVLRINLGDQPLVRLQWGLYAFVPSIACLQAIHDGTLEAAPASTRAGSPREAAAAEADSDSMRKWRLLLEDDNVREHTWRAVREKTAGVEDGEDYGLLVGGKDKVLEVLQDDGSKFSVCGYGERMGKSIGRGYLGMDPHAGHTQQAPNVNALIETIREEPAYEAAFGDSRNYLVKLLDTFESVTGRREAPVDLIEFGRWVLASLCRKWFGLPDGVLMKHGTKADDLTQDGIPRCPGHFGTVSRYIFSPHPMAPVEGPARKHGEMILGAVKSMLRERKDLTPLVDGIAKLPELQGQEDLVAKTVAGVMLGFPPTVLGNLVTVLWGWNESMLLWDLQQDMAAAAALDYDSAKRVLREPLLQTMRKKPVPYMIWRTAAAAEPSGEGPCEGRTVVVGLGSAMDDEGNEMLMFGGDRKEGSRYKTTHACPGYEMAMGVMLGCAAALLTAGTLAKTPDPRVLMLTPLPK